MGSEENCWSVEFSMNGESSNAIETLAIYYVFTSSDVGGERLAT